VAAEGLPAAAASASEDELVAAKVPREANRVGVLALEAVSCTIGPKLDDE